MDSLVSGPQDRTAAKSVERHLVKVGACLLRAARY